MKLSEAIRLGSMLGPQCFEAFVGANHSSCAIGAAGMAVGIANYDEWFKDSLEAEWPWAAQYGDFHCSACGESRSNQLGVIAHLNDMHRWTRERIADWVATIEPEETAAPVEASVDEEVAA